MEVGETEKENNNLINARELGQNNLINAREELRELDSKTKIDSNSILQERKFVLTAQ